MAISTWGVPSDRGGRQRRRAGRAGGAAGPSARLAIGLGLALVLAGLALVHVRTRGIQMRYQLAEAIRAEQRLLEEQRQLTLEVRRLRDPQRLAARAEKLGLARPDRVVALPRVAAPAGAPGAEAAR